MKNNPFVHYDLFIKKMCFSIHTNMYIYNYCIYIYTYSKWFTIPTNGDFPCSKMFYPFKKNYGKPLLYQNICQKKCQTMFARRLHLNWISENVSEYAPEKMPGNMPHKMQEQTNICQIERNGWETMSDWHVRIFAMVGFTRSEAIVVGSIFPKRKRKTRSEISEDKKKQTQ